MVHQSEGARLLQHYRYDSGNSRENLLDALANQLQLVASVGGRVDDKHCRTLLNGGCWDCEEIGRRIHVLARVEP